MKESSEIFVQKSLFLASILIMHSFFRKKNMLYILRSANVLKDVLLCRVKDFASYFLRCTLKSEILVSLKKVFYSVLTLNMELLLFHFTELFHA